MPATMTAGVPPGRYRLGFRPHHLALQPGPHTVPLEATVSVTEITGSESFVHLDHVDGAGTHRDWVLLTHGIVDPPAGERLTVHLDTRHVLIFDEAGRAVDTTERMAA